GVVRLGRNVGQDLKERIVAEVLGVIAVRVASQELVDGLGEQGLGGVLDVLGGAGIRQPLGQVSDDAQRLLQGADSEQARIGDDAAAVKSDVQLLRADVPQGKVRFSFTDHDREPPQDAKLLGKHSLDTA